MFKRCLMVLLVMAVCLMAFPVAICADVLVEPENHFYNRHREECEFLGRSFAANGKDGFVSVKREPGSGREVARAQNEESLYVQFTYWHKGKAWGAVISGDEDGWVPLEQLLLEYDYSAFEQEFKGDFYDYTGSMDALYEAQNVVFWTWPGSGAQAFVLEKEWRNPETDESFLTATQAYKDVEGREWGFFPYVYGVRNTWACLSDPGNKAISAFNTRAPQPWVPEGSGLDTPGSPSAPWLVIILVAALGVGTVVLIKLFYKAKR